MNIWQNNNNKMQFTLFLIGNWNQEGVEASLAWRLENAHITLNMLQNRCPFLYNSSAFLLSFLCIVLISFYPGTLSLEPFPIFYGVIASYYTKRKWQWRQARLFILFWITSFWQKKCFLPSAYFPPFDLKSSLNQKLSSLNGKVFLLWLTNKCFNFFKCY